MKILIIHDGTQRTRDCLKSFTPDFDLELPLCDFVESSESAKNLIEKKVFQQILIAGESIDKRDITKNKFIPYDFLMEIANLDLHGAKIILVSPDKDFLNKGKLIAGAKELPIESVLIQEK